MMEYLNWMVANGDAAVCLLISAGIAMLMTYMLIESCFRAACKALTPRTKIVYEAPPRDADCKKDKEDGA